MFSAGRTTACHYSSLRYYERIQLNYGKLVSHWLDGYASLACIFGGTAGYSLNVAPLLGL